MPPVSTGLKSVRDILQNNGESTSIFARIRFKPHISALQRRTVMISIPNTYAGPHTSAGVVIGAVLAAVGAFVLIIVALFMTFGRQNISESESVVVSESIRSRRSQPRSRARSQRRRTPEVVEVQESVTASMSEMTEEHVIEVFEEEDSFDESPRRLGRRRGSGYRSVEPSEYSGRRPPRNYRRG